MRRNCIFDICFFGGIFKYHQRIKLVLIKQNKKTKSSTKRRGQFCADAQGYRDGVKWRTVQRHKGS